MKAAIKELEEDAAMWNSLAQTFPADARDAKSRHTQVAFAFADECVQRGCLDDADVTYRRLVEFYVGASYSGIRDRARLGIDDVRAARAHAQVDSQ